MDDLNAFSATDTALPKINRAKLSNLMTDLQCEGHRIEMAIECASGLLWDDEWRDAASELLMTATKRLAEMNRKLDAVCWPKAVEA